MARLYTTQEDRDQLRGEIQVLMQQVLDWQKVPQAVLNGWHQDAVAFKNHMCDLRSLAARRLNQGIGQNLSGPALVALKQKWHNYLDLLSGTRKH